MITDPFYLQRQMARLLPDPTERFPGRQKTPTQVSSAERCGLCPLCREMIALDAPESNAADTCPRCGGIIDGLDRLCES